MNLDKRIRYIDFHTHHGTGGHDSVAVMNLMAGTDIPEDFPHNTLFSTGIHPWYLTQDSLESMKTGILLTAAHPHIVCIGEAGFDMLRGPVAEIQHDAFLFQATLSEEMMKPLVIHCVRGWDKLVAERREIGPQMNWVLHGFRGDRMLAANLAKEGFWFSLGIKGITREMLDVIPRERLLLETDDSGMAVSAVYNHYCDVSGIDPDEASDIVRNNFNSLFPTR